MSDDECLKQIADGCGPKVLHENTVEGKAPVFDACLPFGARLYSEGGHVNYEEGTPPEDGVYTSITVKDGCIVEAGYADISTSTATPCAPVPNPCDCSGGGGGSTPISPAAGQLSRLDASGALLTTLNVESDEGVTIQGTGTNTDPLRIGVSFPEMVSSYIRAGNDGLRVEGSGSSADPYILSHSDKGEAKVFNGFSFDRYGHLESYSPREQDLLVAAVAAGAGIETSYDTANRTATVRLARPLHTTKGDYLMGAWLLEVDDNNIIYKIERNFTVPEGVYRAGGVDLAINEYGSITGVAPLSYSVAQNCVVRRFPAASEGGLSMSFTTAAVTSFRVDVEAPALPVEVGVFVDGLEVPGVRLLDNKVSAIASSLYAPGEHTVTLEGEYPANVIVSVYFVTVV